MNTRKPCSRQYSLGKATVPLLFGLMTFLLSLGGMVAPATARAQNLSNVQCYGTGYYETVTLDFGTVNAGAPGGAAIGSSIPYTCTNTNTSAITVTPCLSIGNPPYGTPTQPEMQRPYPNAYLVFGMYRDGAHSQAWYNGSAPVTAQVAIPASTSGWPPGEANGAIPFYGFIPGNQISATPATYNAWFYNELSFSFAAAGKTNCTGGTTSGNTSTLHVTATVINGCTVSATDINFGAATPNATNLAQTGSLSVNCPSGTAYYIGLAPSNGSTSGAGTMSGTGTNTDKVPYQLRSSAGASGALWGNTATSSSVGNGVHGTGTGSAQSLGVHATVPSANYRPDYYSDTVTVNVNY